jgi:hypothetical protein
MDGERNAQGRMACAGLARILLAASLTLAAVTFGASTPAHAGTDCDTSEQVACIPLPTQTSTPAGGAQTASNGVAAPAVPAPIPCVPASCCSVPPGGPLAPGQNIAAPSVCPPPCYPSAAPASAAESGATSAALPVPVPPPGCNPYRGIYSTINLGNAADVRALRTVSTDGLSRYWRQSALAQLQAQVEYLQSVGDYAMARLYSIQVQNATLDLLSNTARVTTLEHWLYQERSSFDGSLVTSQDEWVTNNYVLSLIGNAWYITADTITAAPGPPLIPAGG